MISGAVPDLIVGVDFGMTCTGVSWAKPAFNTTGALTDWPGMPGNNEIKVPTRLIYKDNGALSKWGFLCDDDDDDEESIVFEWFKVYLDPKSLARAHRSGVPDVPNSVDDVRRLTTDFLRQVYVHIKHSMEATSQSWNNKRVQFIFSTPTTWTSQDIVNEFKRSIQNAGFGSDHPTLHTVEMGLTEAEAVAVYTLKYPPVQFHDGDIVLICDAGGGTTDLGLVEIADANLNSPVLKQIAAVSGVGVGSTLIDRGFEHLVQTRLNSFPESSVLSPDLARKLARDPHFASMKHRFGSAAGNTQSLYFKTGAAGFSHSGLRITNGKMEFSRGEIQNLFDTQIRVIIRKIGEQLDWMTNNKGGKYVKYLVLSGGLGGSEYVKNNIEEFFRNSPHLNAPNLAVIRSEDPRLAVSKGLVLDRAQKFTGGRSMLTTRIARASYGVICRQLYNPNIHVSEDVELDLYKSNLRWAVNQITWFIIKGDPIDADTAYKQNKFEMKTKPGDTNRTWFLDIVISQNDKATLPRSMKQVGAFKLCKVKADLSAVNEIEFEEKNTWCWQGRRYFLAIFFIRSVIGPADLTFELWFKGVQYARGHDPITVEFDHVGASIRSPQNNNNLVGLEQTKPS